MGLDDGDPDRTRVLRPRPSGRSSPAAPPAVPAPVPVDAPPLPAAAEPAALAPAGEGGGSMVPLAMPLLQLLGRLRVLPGADAEPLFLRTRAELEAFAARAAGAGFGPDLVRRAQYALCDSLDAAVLQTPWGADSAWSRRTLVDVFHPGVAPGRLHDAVRQAQSRAETLRPALEIMALCLSLRGGGAEDEAFRSSAIAAVLAQAPPAPAELSPRWAGVDAPFRRSRRVRVPPWVAASAALAVAGGVFLLASAHVNAAGDALFARMASTPPSHMPQIARDPAPPPPPPPPDTAHPALFDRLRARLAALPPALADAVSLAGTPAIPVLRLPERALFRPDAATLLPESRMLLDALAGVLKPEGGRLHVLGFTDNRPVHTVLFPSAFKLSGARAEAVRTALASILGADVPVSAEGRGSAEPVAPNTTADGREANRRVELLLDGAPP